MSDERKVVQIGIDLRPIPIKVGEDIWHFSPDVSKEYMSRTMSISQKMQLDTDDRWEAVDELAIVLSEALADPADIERFLDKKYGFAVISAIAKSYSEEIFDFPTKSSKASGGQQKRSGVSK